MPKAGGWPVRGGWVVLALVDDLELRIFNAAGIVGNLGAETAGFRVLHEKRPQVPGSAGGRGWAQWTGYTARNNRRKLFEEFCASHKFDPEGDEGNYRFLVHELETSERRALMHIREARDLWSATRAAHVLYERSGDQSVEETGRRLTWAQDALQGALAMRKQD